MFTGFPAPKCSSRAIASSACVPATKASASTVSRRPTFEPGVDIRAKVTIFADGVRGNLTKQLLRRLPLDAGRQPQQYAIGIKELWEMPPDRVAPGTVIHTLGLAAADGGVRRRLHLRDAGRRAVGRPGRRARLPGSDVRSARRVPALQAASARRGLLRGGQMVRYGAKALPEGGWHTIPRPWMDGGLIAGDAGGFLNSFRLKGIHLAMRTGMLAAETAFDAVRARRHVGGARCAAIERRIDESAVRRELYPVRNVHQASSTACSPASRISALVAGDAAAGGCRPMHGHAGHERMRTLADYYRRRAAPTRSRRRTRPSPIGS